MSNYHDFDWATEEIESARNKSNGRKLENNTRLFQRSDDTFAVKLHAVDVVTINRDGTYTLRNGGWDTVTTMDRIRTYSPVRGTLFSERGEWFVRMTPDANDPAPTRVERSIPKPYTSVDPGPEPVKNDEGCVAGQLITTEHVNEVVETWRKDMREGDELVEVVDESSITSDGGYDRVKVKRSWNSHSYIGEGAQPYQDEGWGNLDDNHNRHGGTFTNDDGETVTYVQCSHCKDFDTVYEGWRFRMYGERWSRRFDAPGGYSVYADMIERFGTEEAWHEAYIEDLRERRAYLQAEREWDQRNRIPFYDGIVVDSNGYAGRKRKGGPSKAKLNKHEREVKKIKKQIDKYVDGFIAALKEGMPMPGNGDCWFCLFRDSEGKTWGDMGDNTHLLDHMEERYYVPSLATNALLERGYQPTGVYMWLDMDADNNTMGKPEGRYDGVKRDLRTYLTKRLVPSAPTK